MRGVPEHICDFGCERDVFGLHTIGGPAAPPLIVVDEMERIGPAVQVGHEIAVVEIRSTMEDDDFRTLPELSRIQLCVPNRDMASRGMALRWLSSGVVELGGNHAGYAIARTARASVAFIAH